MLSIDLKWDRLVDWSPINTPGLIANSLTLFPSDESALHVILKMAPITISMFDSLDRKRRSSRGFFSVRRHIKIFFVGNTLLQSVSGGSI